MNNVFKIKTVSVNEDGKLVEELNIDIMEESNTIELIDKPSPNPTDIMTHYTSLDEDDLFDYEKIVIPFSRESLSSHSATLVNLAVVIENGKIYVEELRTERRHNSFERYFSRAEFEVAVESQVHSLESNDANQLTWIQMQQPGLYRTPSGVLTVFKDKDGQMNFTLDGSSEVWLSPANPNERPILNEKLSSIVPAETSTSNTVDPDAIETLRNSEAFQRMRAALNNG